MSTVNHQFRLAARPVGLPKRSDWSLTEEPAPEPGDGEFLVKILYISLDPAMRGWMNEGRSYIAPVGVGEVMRAGAVGRVIASRRPGFAVGDYVYGSLGVQEYALSNGGGVTKVDPSLAPLPVFLGALGLPGMTAYFGLRDIGKPQPGQTLVVSGAAGAVGLVAELGFDAAIDYKAEDVRKALRQQCPKGVDIYFDNVGGDILDAALANLAAHARIVICGAISQYNNTTPVKGPSNYLSLLVNRASMAGMVVFDYANRYPEATSAIAGWLAAGKLKSREDVVTGFTTFPETLLKLFAGENFGKLVLQVADA
jgi:hypothetical protein